MEILGIANVEAGKSKIHRADSLQDGNSGHLEAMSVLQKTSAFACTLKAFNQLNKSNLLYLTLFYFTYIYLLYKIFYLIYLNYILLLKVN